MTTINLVTDMNAPANNGINVHISSLDEMTNGSIENIVCSALDSFDIKDRGSILVNIMKKVKNNGQLIIQFLDFKKISKDFYNNKLSSEYVTNIINNIKSVYSYDEILDLIDTQKYFSVQKKYYDNYMLIMHLVKKI